MPRPKIKDGIKKLFYLDKEEVELIKNLSIANMMSQSEFVGFIIRNYYLQQDPLKKLEDIRKKRARVEQSLINLKLEEDESISKMKTFEETKKLRDVKKEEAINIIKRKIISGADYLETQEIARFWSFRLNLDMNELIFLASKELKENKSIETFK